MDGNNKQVVVGRMKEARGNSQDLADLDGLPQAE
jgi:hypothetical protein